MYAFDYHRPRSLLEARQLKATIDGSQYVAGGTDLLVRMKQGRVRPAALVSLRGVPELSGITVGPHGARLGATTLIREIVEHPELARSWPALVRAARELGGEQVRNAATLGGNLSNASPCADTAPPLLVLDARVELIGDDGPRTMPLEQFFVGPKQTALRPGEVLAAVWLDPVRQPSAQLFVKHKRVAMDLAIASLAMRLELDGDRCLEARVAVGSVAPTPVRLYGVEAALAGQRITPELLARVGAAAEAEVRPITDVRGPAGYRRRLIGVFTRRAVETLVGWRAR